ncbi:MAG TPA: DUF2726 domain-containing protein [Syntrophobacteraceae bacterium]|nr:DUF2726 domain-containing protein [Syntrophobacteraceae bacterium]
MYYFSQLLAVIVIVVVVMKFMSANKDLIDRWKFHGRFRSCSYIREPVLFSHSERSFLGVLERVLGSEYRVFGKVRIADLLRPENGVGRQAALNRITRKHVDFVVCDDEDLSVIGVIELDDNSHRQPSRRKRDAFVDGAFASAGLPIVRFPAEATYSRSAVREAIERQFNIMILEPCQAPPKSLNSAKVTSLCDFRHGRGNEKQPNAS